MIRWIILAKQPVCREGNSVVLSRQFESATQEKAHSLIRRLEDREGSLQSIQLIMKIASLLKHRVEFREILISWNHIPADEVELPSITSLHHFIYAPDSNFRTH